MSAAVPSQRTDISLNRYLIAATVIVAFGFVLRSIALLTLPVQWLEAMHLLRAELVLSGSLFDHPMSMRKWMSVPALAFLFRPGGPESLWLARIFSALLGVLNIAGALALGRMLFNDRRVGLLAGLIYAVLPLAVFHERQALSDPLFVTLVTFVTLLSLVYARRPSLKWAILLGVTLGGAYLAKVATLPYFFLPGLAILLFTPRKRWVQAIGYYAGSLVLMTILIVAAYNFYFQANPQDYDTLSQALIGQIIGLSPGGSAPTGGYGAALARQFTDLADVTGVYIGWIMLALSIAGLVIAVVMTNQWKQALFIAFPAYIFLTPIIVSGLSTGRLREPYLPGRYILQHGAPMAALAALAVLILIQRFSKSGGRAASISAVVLIALVTAPAMWFDAVLVSNPSEARLTRIDDSEYLSGYNSGYGHVDVAEYLLQVREEEGAEAVYMLVNGNFIQVESYLGHNTDLGSVSGLRAGDQLQRDLLAERLGAGAIAFIMNQRHPSIDAMPENPHGTDLELVTTIDSPAGALEIYRIVGATGPLAQRIFEQSVPRPDQMTEDYAELAPTLGETVYVFPGGQQAGFDRPTNVLEADSWPLDQTAADEIVASFGTDGGIFDVVLVDELSSDPNRFIATTLQANLYWMDETFAGLLRRQRFMTGPAEPEFQPINGVFENVIQINEAAIVDQQVQPGGQVRIALRWGTSAEIADSFTVFVHLFDPNLNLVAQTLNIPGNGLYPMIDWQPGDVIEDRYALQLPDGIPLGTYQAWVGVTDEEKALRLLVTDGIETGDNYVVVGRFEVGE